MGAFTDQSSLWQADNLRLLADNWPQLAASGLSIGDATIKDVAEYYARDGYLVEILTGDAGLKAYQPSQPSWRHEEGGSVSNAFMGSTETLKHALDELAADGRVSRSGERRWRRYRLPSEDLKTRGRVVFKETYRPPHPDPTSGP